MPRSYSTVAMGDGRPESNSTPVRFVLAPEITRTARLHQARMHLSGLSCSNTDLVTLVVTADQVGVRGDVDRIT